MRLTEIPGLPNNGVLISLGPRVGMSCFGLFVDSDYSGVERLHPQVYPELLFLFSGGVFCVYLLVFKIGSWVSPKICKG